MAKPTTAMVLLALVLTATAGSACGGGSTAEPAVGTTSQPSTSKIGQGVLDTPAADTTLVPPPTAATTAAPAPTSPPDIPLEESLEGDDLVKYRELPPKFQNALQEEARQTGRERALQYLHDLPDETVSIAELLDPGDLSFLPFNALALFYELGAPRQRALLLGGYADAVQHDADRRRQYADERGVEEPDPKGYAVLFAQMVELSSRDVSGRLPPIDRTLSPEALTKLETLDTLMRRVFRERWEQMEVPTGQVERVVADLERGLLAAPGQLPPIEEIGLSPENVALFKQLPAEMRQWLWQHVAGDLARGRSPKGNYLFSEELLRFWSTPTARDAFARGYSPAQFGITTPLVCGPTPWPAPVLLEDLPDRPVFLPPPEGVLSKEALARIEAMDPSLQQAFNEDWETSGPVMPDRLPCVIATLELNVLAAPLTAVPALEDFLPPELVDLYQRLPADIQRRLERELAGHVLRGRTQGMMYPGSHGALAPFGDVDLDAFLGALRTWVEWRIWGLARIILQTTGAQQSEVAEGPSEVTRLEEDVAKYRTLPAGIVEELHEEIERVSADARPTTPGPVSIQDVLDPDEQEMFDRLPVILKQTFWRSVARELVHGSAIQTVGGKIIGNAPISARAWVQFASQVPASR